MKPLVSICCITFNHIEFISDSIEGFLKQKTSFPFEIIIHDDASVDGTARIVKDYADRYPDLIVPILQKENQWSKGIRISAEYVWPKATGKYIALCEGDDYWTDPYKLQKQVDFMETNQDFSICFHPVQIKLEEKQKLVDDFVTREVDSETDIMELAKGNYIHTPSVLFRRGLFNLDVFCENKTVVGDYFLYMLNAQHGKIKKLPDTMAVYRVHKGGIWSMTNQKQRVLNYLDFMIDFFAGEDFVEVLEQRRANILKGDKPLIWLSRRLHSIFKRIFSV